VAALAGDIVPDERRAYIETLRQALGDQQTFLPVECNEGDVVCRAGDPSDALFLILTGKYRVSRVEVGGAIVVNNLGSDSYFGESCIAEDAVRTSTVEALTRGLLVKLPAALVRLLIGAHPAILQKLHNERQRFKDRDLLAKTLSRLPPREPPQPIASKLLRATNLLLIDMEKCTRCDQCVRSCGEAHDDVPRFHRANPELRFGKWEVAGACLHCVDAPCQAVCPVGAITLLDTRAVQIHRDRCIGCTQCAFACPFHVVDMYKPANPEEAPGLSKKNPDVATKCDLCLTADREPPCVVGCPYDAAFRGAPEKFFPALSNWAVFEESE
jgi:Fe-S-cluster-containing dehydrogenase component